jgi:hypothetical protein
MVECADNTCVVFFDISDANFSITSSCAAATNNICLADAVTYPAGNAGLNLGLNQFYGDVISSYTVNIDGTETMVPRALASTQGGSTCTTVGNRSYEMFDIGVNVTGTYTLSITSPGFTAVSVFTAAGFDINNPCNSNFFGSNAWSTGGGGASSNSSFSTVMNLVACNTYKVVVYASTSAYGDNTVSFSGPGTVYFAGNNPGGNYSYTYAAVNTATGLVAMVNASSDLPLWQQALIWCMAHPITAEPVLRLQRSIRLPG